ncbi:hypothetical protein [Streptomyces sp. NBC_00154]|uniref:hypothetical protein n=1 Tax=Streptomyces sp. NBC_00154 TaxID=2975670 RepID=UPI00225BA6A7|nr:hypothetical protein [Streptomyces sp. NBC_00154]MCX5316036.1 hypothetical protein [Streptomyces sp. NBC_00154]
MLSVGSETHGSPREPVTASDIEQAVRLAIATLSTSAEQDWSARADSLRWDCWETVEHLADDLFFYAAQLAPWQPPQSDAVPYDWQVRREGGPANVIFMDRAAGTAGLFQGLEACTAILAAVVRTAPPAKRAHHVYGLSDAEGFAAMAVVETLVHTYDIAEGLGLAWAPPAGLCARVLARLFPHVPADAAAPWPALLWATGRIALEGRPQLTEWRWYSVPHGDADAATVAEAPAAEGTAAVRS